MFIILQTSSLFRTHSLQLSYKFVIYKLLHFYHLVTFLQILQLALIGKITNS
jgi:hypothetical protein